MSNYRVSRPSPKWAVADAIMQKFSFRPNGASSNILHHYKGPSCVANVYRRSGTNSGFEFNLYVILKKWTLGVTYRELSARSLAQSLKELEAHRSEHFRASLEAELAQVKDDYKNLLDSGRMSPPTFNASGYSDTMRRYINDTAHHLSKQYLQAKGIAWPTHEIEAILIKHLPPHLRRAQ